MSLAKLSHDLKTQARQLATHEPKRPKQASLRRAVSAAYYSLFHLLTEEAAQLLLKDRDIKPLQQLMQRTFSHGAMKTAAKAFAGGNLAPAIAQHFPGPISADLSTVATTFIDLQDARHRADYDLSYSFTRQEVLDLIQAVDDAVQCWEQIRKQPDAKTFLVMLLTYESLRKR